MGDKKNIDRLFQEQFRDFEVAPDEAVWDKIAQDLDENQKSRKKIIPLWFKVSGIAATLILLVSLGVNTLSTLSTNNNGNGVVNTTDQNKTSQSLDSDSNSAVTTTKENQSNGVNQERNGSSNTNINSKNSTGIVSGNTEGQNNGSGNELENNIDKQGEALVDGGQNKSGTGKGDRNSLSNQLNKNRLANQENVDRNNTLSQNKNQQAKQEEIIASQDNKSNQSPIKLELQPNKFDKDAVVTNNNNNKEVVVVNDQTDKKVVPQSDKENVGLEKTSKEILAAQDRNKTLFETNVSGKDKKDAINGQNNERIAVNNGVQDGEKKQIETDNPFANSIDKAVVDATVNHRNNEDVVEAVNKKEGLQEGLNKQEENTADATALDKKNDLENTPSELKALAQEAAGKEQNNEGGKELSETVASVEEEEEKKEEELAKEDDKKSIEEAIAEQETAKEVKEEIDESLRKKWNVAPSVAPVYYNTLSQGSPIDEQFKSNPKKAQVSMSYGLHFSYDIGKRWSVRSGVQKLEVGYKTEQVAVLALGETSGVTSSKPRNVDLAPQAEGLDIISSANVVAVQMPSNFSSLLNSSLEQRLGYLEVPLELTYKITQSRFSLRVIGGMSTFILNDNEIYANWLNEKRLVGKAANVNQVSFSTNLGLGASYDIGKSFYFNLEPTFKYQLNPFSSDSGNFKPYILGVYSGFSFKF